MLRLLSGSWVDVQCIAPRDRRRCERPSLLGSLPRTCAGMHDHVGDLLATTDRTRRGGNHGTHAGSKGAHMNLAHLPQGPVSLAGPSNGGLADPGHGALIALLQVTVCFLLHGRADSMEPMTLPTLRVLQRMTDEAGD